MSSRKDAQKQLWREIREVAAADLEALDEEIAALGAVCDEYYLAGGLHARAEQQLAAARTLADIRAVAALAADARHELDCGHARESVPRRARCFFDPAHGRAARAAEYAPSGGRMERVAACEPCGAAVDAGHAPAIWKVERDDRRFAYWRDPAHIAYFGHEGVKVADLVIVEERRREFGDQGLGLFDWLDDWLSPV
ncbi:hypothetical protein [Solirubrobacter soli]|uniref:hypothetical protein n=1 Tax=Solirubrobacter soli TaxID=363832 RepID=UPI0003FECCC0|nr:hypothetical protein [Solirubrobacter soli]